MSLLKQYDQTQNGGGYLLRSSGGTLLRSSGGYFIRSSGSCLSGISTYLGYLRYDINAILEHEEVSASFHDQTIYYPYNWGEEEIIEFKKYATETIQKHLYNKLHNKSWWDDKMYHAGLKYWKNRLAA